MAIPTATVPLMQHALDTYASETAKTASVWSCFHDDDAAWRPHDKSMTVRELFRHHLLSERRFFADFLEVPEPAPAEVPPAVDTVAGHILRLRELSVPRLAALAARDEAWWLTETKFFDVQRQHAWIFWRRVLHSAHHRTQLTVYLRLLNRPVPSIYGPSADVTWSSATPTLTT